MHICHASTAGTVEILKWAKQQAISITAEVTPHHLLLDDSRLASYDGRNRVNPPLREAADTQALRRALADGVIDCVATDHARTPNTRSAASSPSPGRACWGCKPPCRWSWNHGEPGSAELAWCGAGDERESGPHRRAGRPGPPAWVGSRPTW